MPEVTCMNLQAAQDKIQADAGVFYSRSHDRTGQERKQMLDATGSWLNSTLWRERRLAKAMLCSRS